MNFLWSWPAKGDRENELKPLFIVHYQLTCNPNKLWFPFSFHNYFSAVWKSPWLIFQFVVLDVACKSWRKLIIWTVALLYQKIRTKFPTLEPVNKNFVQSNGIFLKSFFTDFSFFLEVGGVFLCVHQKMEYICTHTRNAILDGLLTLSKVQPRAPCCRTHLKPH